MENLKRKLFFWTLVALFLIIAPVIVLHAKGYRFDLSRGIFVYSGTITIKSNPLSVNVKLNEQPNESKNLDRLNSSYNITGLLPNDYKIEVSYPQYQSWSKKTDVHSGVSSEFWNVVLVRNEYEKTDFSDTSGIQDFYMSPKNQYIAYTQSSDEGLLVKLFNISDETTTTTFSFSSWKLISDSKKENIEWSPNENYFLVPVEREIKTMETKDKKNNLVSTETISNETAYYVANPEDGSSFNLNDFLGKKEISDVRWDPNDKDYLFFLEGNSLYRSSITDKTDVILISEDVASFDLSQSGVYFIKLPNNLVYKTSLDGKSEKTQITSEFPQMNNSDKINRMTVYDDSRIAFISENKDLFIFNEGDKDTYFKKLGSDVEGTHFSDDGKKMLFWTTNEISIYFVRVWEVQPTRLENEMQNVTRYSEPIKNVQWFKDYEHVIFSTGRWIKFIELDPRDHRNCTDLTNTTLETPFVRFNNSLERLYFTENKDNSTILESIIFPEPTPILGIGG